MKISSQLRRLVPLALGGLALAGFVASTSPIAPNDPGLDTMQRIAQQNPAQAICDVDGVDVAYHTAYRSSPTLGYDVINVVVSNISWPTCSPSRLKVALTVLHADSSTELATGEILDLSTPPGDTTVINSGGQATATMPLRINPPSNVKADAAKAVSVAVELEGGSTPVPAECSGMKFAKIQVGTLGNDDLTGSNPAGDLIYGLQGSDKITSLQGDDCVITPADDAGDDTITLGNGVNVVTTGAGNDTITVGNGARNRISTGAGNDRITVGNGKNNVIDGGAGDDLCYVPKSVKVISLPSCTRVDT